MSGNYTCTAQNPFDLKSSSNMQITVNPKASGPETIGIVFDI